VRGGTEKVQEGSSGGDDRCGSSAAGVVKEKFRPADKEVDCCICILEYEM
jgi:hypothetical protein